MKKFFFYTWVCLCAFAMRGQTTTHNTISEQFSKLVNVPNSPEAEAFAKYGDIDVSLHTGTPNIAVPLYTIKGRELDIPITLTYDASGVKVDQVATNVGLSWNLNVGGRISRQVRGLPDDYETSLSDYYSLKDFLEVRSKFPQYKNFDGFNFDDILVGSTLEQNKNYLIAFTEFMRKVYKSEYDIEQDYFSLNILGVNETIWMDTDTYQAKVLNNPNLKVDLYRSGHPETIMGGKVTDAAGNQYFFGTWPDPYAGTTTIAYPFDLSDPTQTNPIERVERRSTNDTPTNLTLTIKYRSSWMVNRIISANGKDVYDFKYTNNIDFDSPEFSSVINGVKTHSLFLDDLGTPEYTEAGLPFFNDNHSITDVKSHFQQQFLTTIYHNGREVVRFDFTDRDDLDNGTNKAIASFSVYEDYANAPTALQKVDFEYDTQYFGHNFSDPNDFQNHYNIRLKLDKVSFGTPTVKNFYQFEYNDPYNLINRKSFAQDYMGYYNGHTANPCLFEEMQNVPGGSDGLTFLTGADRSVDPNVSQKGMLTKMSYPTGGYTEFTYENHYDGTDYYPGLRIKSVENYTDNGVLATRKDYQYTTAFGGSGSSLIENFAPTMHLEVPLQSNPLSACQGGNEPTNPTLLYRYASPPNMGTHPYITYGSVFEVHYDTGVQQGYSKYDFYNVAANGWTNTTFTPPFEKNYYSIYKDGKVNTATVYDNNGNPLVITDNTYTDENEEEEVYQDQTSVFNRNLMHQYSYYMISDMGNGTFPVFKVPFNCGGGTYIPDNITCELTSTECIIEATDFLPSLDLKRINIFGYTGGTTQVKKTEHFGGQMVETTTNNSYKDDGTYLLSATATDIGDGDRQRTEYYYPNDFGSNPVTDALIAQNKVSIPLMVKTKRVDANNTPTLLSTQFTQYKNWTVDGNNYTQPEIIKSEKGNTGSGLEDRIQIKALDPYGNIREASLITGSSVTYLWGYNGRYLVAKIENRTYGDLNGTKVAAVENATPANMATALQNLRNDSATAGGLMTSFTYLPMIGVSTVTDPRGYTMSYHYDEHHRLQYVKDPDGNVLSENEYSYRINN